MPSSNAPDPLPDRSAVKRFAVSESGFVFDPTSGRSFTVNETGLSILRALQQDVSWQDLRVRLMEEFAVDQPTLERDLSEFVNTLREQFA